MRRVVVWGLGELEDLLPPHLLVTRDHQAGYFDRMRVFLEREPGRHSPLDAPNDDPWQPIEELERVALFPDQISDVEWETPWGRK